MGRSVDAHLAFGWIMPEGWDVPEELTYGEHGCLEAGFAGSLWAGEPQHVLFHKDSETWATYEAKVATIPTFTTEWDAELRRDAEDLGIKLPDVLPQWIVWALEG